MMKALLPWLTAGGLLVSFTASAGYPPAQLPNLDLATPASSILRMSSPAESQPWSGMFATEAYAEDADRVPQPARISTTRRVPSSNDVATPVALFQPELAAASLTSLEGVAYAYEGYMPPIFLDTPRQDGATSGDVHGDAAPGSAYGPTSPSLLSVLTARVPDGSTPGVPRAVSLASTTPAPVEPEIVAMPRIPLGGMTQSVTGALAAINPEIAARPDYASLIDPDHMAREQKCLAEAIYFEARSEPVTGQAAVAQVVLNRVRSGLYPSNVCGVVYQNRHRYLGCQFSFACEGKSLRITEPGPWQQAVRVAKDVTEGKTYLSGVGGATHYHANYVKPTWSRRLQKMEKIGTHIFYSLRPGQV